jgi:hypothetical protein
MKQFILDILKLLKPKHYDKVTWVLIAVGILLVSRPTLVQILNEFLKRNYQFEIIGKHDVLIGFVLIILALIYNTIIKLRELNTSRQIPETINAPLTNNGNNIQDNHGTVIQNNYNFNITVANPNDIQNIVSTIQKTNDTVSFTSLSNKALDTRFVNLFSELPWVDKLCIEPYGKQTLIQRQTLYSLSYLVGKNKTNKLLVQPIEINGKVFKPEKIEERNLDFLVAIYWTDYNMWTLNSLFNFSKNDNSIDFTTALKNDLSNLFGDFTFIIDKASIKIIYDNNDKSTNIARHAEYGAIKKTFVIDSDSKETEITTLDLSIIDALFKTEVISVSDDRGIFTTIEKNSHSSIVKLTTLVQIILGQYKQELTPIDIKFAITVINDLLIKKINALVSQPIPTDKNEQTDYLYKLSFDGTKVYESYKS